MEYVRTLQRTGWIAGIVMSVLGPAAWADSTLENVAETHYSNPNQYSFSSTADSELLQFDAPRRMRICLSQQEDVVPLLLEYDNRKVRVDPGECEQIETQTVRVRPAENIPDGKVLMWNYHEDRD